MNAFDKFAKPITESKSAKEKIQADVTPDIKTKVDLFVANKASMKKMEADQKEIETAIISHVRPQQDEMGFCGTHTKSLQVQGNTTTLTFVTMDKFSVPQDEPSLTALKKLLGKKYTDLFTIKRFITLKDSVLKDDTILNKIADACTKAGLSIPEIFDIGDKVIAKDDLDRKQYDLTKKALVEFRTLVTQAKPALK